VGGEGKRGGWWKKERRDERYPKGSYVSVRLRIAHLGSGARAEISLENEKKGLSGAEGVVTVQSEAHGGSRRWHWGQRVKPSIQEKQGTRSEKRAVRIYADSEEGQIGG